MLLIPVAYLYPPHQGTVPSNFFSESLGGLENSFYLCSRDVILALTSHCASCTYIFICSISLPNRELERDFNEHNISNWSVRLAQTSP